MLNNALTSVVPVGVLVPGGAKRAGERPHAGDPHADDSGRLVLHRPTILQQAREVRHEDGRLGRRELGDLF